MVSEKLWLGFDNATRARGSDKRLTFKSTARIMSSSSSSLGFSPSLFMTCRSSWLSMVPGEFRFRRRKRKKRRNQLLEILKLTYDRHTSTINVEHFKGLPKLGDLLLCQLSRKRSLGHRCLLMMKQCRVVGCLSICFCDALSKHCALSRVTQPLPAVVIIWSSCDNTRIPST
jgi:hypothetical protein